jgi:hypothetical protein
MVQRIIKIPKHGGPDGVGLDQKSFDQLLNILNDETVSDNIAKSAIELCLSASKQQEWNDNYRPKLVEQYTPKESN